MEFPIHVILLLFLQLSLCFTTHAATSSNTDELALMSFKSHITSDPNGVLTSWNRSLHYCSWHGVTCGQRHPDRVVGLNLSPSVLVGNITPEIGKFTFLRVLNISGSNFSGTIPHGIGSLTRLQTLLLSKNQLVGRIPPSIGNLLSLRVLSMGTNKMVGTIPSSLGNLRNLSFLDLSVNNLSGTIPSSIYSLTSIQIFTVYQNKLHGNIPNNVAFFNHGLQVFSVMGNEFSGSIPTSLCNATNLQHLQLHNNNFGGVIPPCIGNMKQMECLILANNHFQAKTSTDWSFIDALSNCTSMKILQLHGNDFEGELPQTLSNLSITIQQLSIGGGRMSGSIPKDIGRFTNLTHLNIYQSNIGGEIPNSIGQLISLGSLRLTQNSLVGQIPASLFKLTKLTELYLNGNKLNGGISESIRNMKNLYLLDLSCNGFDGSIPKELFTIGSIPISLNLSNNNFSGSLPSEVGLLSHLVEFDVSHNLLSGTVPFTLETCIMLRTLHMENNLFHGSIPSSIEKLGSLEIVDISKNHLSGAIPSTMGKLALLKQLNLSYNNLEGEVPEGKVFADVSLFSFVGNKGLCGGPSSLHLQPCVQHKNKNVILIVLVCLSSLILLTSFTVLCFWKRESSARSSASSSISIEDSHSCPSYAELLKATDGFSSTHWIGAGSFGSVYKGFVESIGKQVAIKVFKLQQTGALRSFMAECQALSNIRHRNLVKILTACSSIDFKGNDFKALVYEFIPNGSLAEWLHSDEKRQDQSRNCLTLMQRLNIAIDVAGTLDYLHCGGQYPIVHCDLKPSNVLLDNEMTAYVGDFGLARILLNCGNELSETFTSSLLVKGTIGYIPPEYGIGSKISPRGDVFSYGILLLEMVTGKKPTDDTFDEGSNLYKTVESSFPADIWTIVDPILIPQVDIQQPSNIKSNAKVEDCLISMVRCGLLCAKESPTERTSMKDVQREMIMIRQNLLEGEGQGNV